MTNVGRIAVARARLESRGWTFTTEPVNGYVRITASGIGQSERFHFDTEHEAIAHAVCWAALEQGMADERADTERPLDHERDTRPEDLNA